MRQPKLDKRKTYFSSTKSDAIALEDINGNYSIVLLDLNIPQKSFNITLDTYESSYVFNDSSYTNVSGNYVDSITSSHGCDSIVYLDLNILQNPFQNTPTTVCIGDTINITFSLNDNEILLSDNNIIDSTFIVPSDEVGSHNLVVQNYRQADNYFIDTSGQFSYIDISATETFLNLGDEDQSDFLEIGFEFNYWGMPVDSFIVTSNGWITFDGNSDYDYDIGLPVHYENFDNSIFLIDVDLNTEEGGQISYATIGTAPNRTFVVDFDSVSFYEDPAIRFSSQLQIYEANNRIEIHTESADNVSNDVNVSQGIQSPDQNIALVVPGRNKNKWIATNDYVAFIPDSFVSATTTHSIEVISPTSSTQTISSCDSYDWIDGNTYTTSNNSATHTLTSVAGCDSVVTLDLTIQQSTSYMINLTEFNSVTFNGIVFNESIDTSITIMNSVGCDSIISLNLTILNSEVNSSQTVEICNGETLEVGNSTYSNAGVYVDTLNTQDGCCDSIVTTTIIVLSQAETPIISRPLILTLETTQNYESYQWRRNGTEIEGETSYQLNVSEPGSYQVEVSNQHGCTALSDPYNLGTSNINESFTERFTVYPNPTRSIVTIESKEMGQYKLIDIYGKQILKGEKITLEQEVDLSNLADGLYFILFKEKTFQIIKQ
jgi:hypothetical protein